jgi:hypothetical protein
MGVLETPRIKRKTMKVIVRYWTEFGGSESTMNVEEIANFANKFDIMSVTPIEEEKKYNEVFDWLAEKDYLSDKVETIQKEFEDFKNKNK